MDQDIDILLARHRAFWERTPVDRPLIHAEARKTWQPRPYPLTGGGVAHDSQPISPSDVDVPRIGGRGQPLPELVSGDLLNAVAPLYPEAWMEALAGCAICVSAYGCVSRPMTGPLSELADQLSVERALESDWFGVMKRVREESRERAGAGRPIRQLHYRGIVDILAAMLGEERLCLAAYDAPDELDSLADRLMELHRAVVTWDLASRPLWHDGCVSTWRVYAPGPLLDYQIDASSLFSPDVYAARFASHDRRVLATIPYSGIHLHSVGLHMLEIVLAMSELRMVEINLDREALPWDKAAMLRHCRRVQDAGKSLIIQGELSEHELKEFSETLDPAGLAIDCWHESVRPGG